MVQSLLKFRLIFLLIRDVEGPLSLMNFFIDSVVICGLTEVNEADELMGTFQVIDILPSKLADYLQYRNEV